MINTLEEYRAFNPVRDHLSLHVEAVEEEDRVAAVVGALRDGGFDPSVSRALVFVQSRRKAEELADELSTLTRPTDPWHERVGSFHAGMSAEDRDDAYRAFRSGRLAVLFATKAFGMGMDIPNVHYIFHHDCPTSLEDYLQEVGRAGRDPEALLTAGFADGRTVRCVLYSTAEDFRKKKDRVQESQLAWSEVGDLSEAVFRYARRTGQVVPSEDRAFPLPLDLYRREVLFEGKNDAPTRQRVGLHWLERLGRIRLGHYLPAHLAFHGAPTGDGEAYGDGVAGLCRTVSKAARTEEEGTGGRKEDESVGGGREAGGLTQIEPAPDGIHDDQDRLPVCKGEVLVSTTSLLKATGTRDFVALFRVIATAQKAGLLRLRHEIHATATNKRSAEVDYYLEQRFLPDRVPPALAAAYDVAAEVLRQTAGRTIEIDGDWLDLHVAGAVGDHFREAAWGWVEEAKRADRLEKDRSEFFRPYRARAILRLVRTCPRVALRAALRDDGGVVRHVTNDNDRWEPWLAKHRTLAGQLLAHVRANQLGGRKMELVEALVDLNVPEHDIDLLESTLLFLKGMGYVRYSGPLVPMAVEAYPLSDSPINAADEKSDDALVLRDFEETRRFKALRLAALEALTLAEDDERRDALIRSYFADCSTSDDVFDLLETHLPEAHEVLSQLRGEALNHLVDGEPGGGSPGLDEDQKAVYDAPLSRSLIVAAGPGSGKTRTLLLRLARLIHVEAVDPSRILVLAYNRAVVAELKHRLADLFGRLGYRHLTKGVNVFTFHGLVRYCLGDRVGDLEDGDGWIAEFNRTVREEPGRVWQRIQRPSFVFVDEYQDVTKSRYEMLTYLAPPGECRVTAIGDPNQSIYGYDRVRETGTYRSDGFFQRVREDYDADELRLHRNYRSLPDIVWEAERVIQPNEGRILSEPLEPVRSPRAEWTLANRYFERVDPEATKWVDRLYGLLNERSPLGRSYRSVAILFRTNPEVYRWLNVIRRDLARRNVNVRVQGEAARLHSIREVAHHLDGLRDRLDDSIRDGELTAFIDDTPQPKRALGWATSPVVTLRLLAHHFEATRRGGETYGEFVEFVREAGRDDSQIAKLVDLAGEQSGLGQEVVLSTFHKVKGLEFDAVLIPPSSADLPQVAGEFDRTLKALYRDEAEAHRERLFGELVEEERRVYYVGMTRARDRLLLFEWERERAMQAGHAFELDRHTRSRMGIPIGSDSDFGLLNLSKAADPKFIEYSARFPGPHQFHDYVHLTVQAGDPIEIRETRNGSYRFYEVHHQPGGGGRWRCVGQLSRSGGASLWERKKRAGLEGDVLRGLAVTAVTRYTLEESLRYDVENSTSFSKGWDPFFKSKGYVYAVQFSGYAL